MIRQGDKVTCRCGTEFTAQHDEHQNCSRKCAAQFRRPVGGQLGRNASANWKKNTDESRCQCSECKAGRKAALERLAAKGLGLRKFTAEEWQKRMRGVAAARKQGDTYAWSE